MPSNPSRSQTSEFLRVRRLFADLRLVCHTWKQLITPYLFRNMVVHTSPLPRLKRVAKAFDVYPELVRSVTLMGKADIVSLQPFLHGDIIGHCLKQCVNLDTLICYGMHLAFCDATWMQKKCPNLPPTVKSLTISRSYSPLQLRSALEGMYASLVQLTLIHCEPHRTLPWKAHIVFSLARLHIEGGSPDWTILSKLFKRVKAATLTELVLIELPRVDQKEILNLLQINNLCAKLKLIELRLALRHEGPHALGLPIAVLKLCPSLTHFSYTSPSSIHIFEHLPSGLQHLELRVSRDILPNEMPVDVDTVLASIDPFLAYLSSDRACSLKTLSVRRERPCTLTFADQDLDDELCNLHAACNERNILLTYTLYKGLPGTVMTREVPEIE